MILLSYAPPIVRLDVLVRFAHAASPFLVAGGSKYESQ